MKYIRQWNLLFFKIRHDLKTSRLPLTYEWEVPQGVVGRYELTDSNRILKINNVQQDDSGEYSCRVTSSKGSGQQADKKSYVLYVECKLSQKIYGVQFNLSNHL
jgi:hypothetical protein